MKDVQSKKKSDRRLRWDRWSTIIMSIFIVAMLATVIAVVLQKSTAPSATSDYEGTIIDRWADYRESDLGSQPRLRLVIESQDGKRFIAKVDPNVYESAKIGMRIQSRSGQIVLIDSDRDSTRRK